MILANGDDLHLIFFEWGMRLVAQEAQYISQTSEAAYLTCIESLSEKMNVTYLIIPRETRCQETLFKNP